MKKVLFSAAFVLTTIIAFGQSGLLKKAGGLLKGGSGSSLSSDEVGNGLKEALSIGVQKGSGQLSAANGFFGNAAVKILMPPDAQKVEKTLRGMGMGKQVDDAI